MSLHQKNGNLNDKLNASVNHILKPCLHDLIFCPETPKVEGLYFHFLEAEETKWIAPGLKATYKDVEHIRVVGIKGNLEQPEAFELLHEGDMLWMAFQFLGKSIINNGTVQHLTAAEYVGFKNGENNTILQIDRGKTWLSLIGIRGDKLPALQAEYEKITGFLFTNESMRPDKAFPIGYKQKRILDKIQGLPYGAYSLPAKIVYHVNQLVELFEEELVLFEDKVNHAEVALYYRALDYIKQHILYRKILRKEMADHLCVTEKTLTRAFSQKKTTIRQMIQVARLDKAREWIRQNDRPLEEIIADLHFEEADFITAYSTLFNSNPEEDCKKHRRTKPGDIDALR